MAWILGGPNEEEVEVDLSTGAEAKSATLFTSSESMLSIFLNLRTKKREN